MDELADALRAERIAWRRDLDDPFLFHATALGRNFDLRLGDFPEEVMFTLSWEGVFLAEFDDRPEGWHLPPRDLGPAM